MSMATLFSTFSTLDLGAISFFIVCWIVFELGTVFSSFGKRGTGYLMAQKRREWMLVMVDRELRIVDTSIIAGLLQGTAFFASTSILAIGGCLAMLGSLDQMLALYDHLPVNEEQSKALLELKILGLAAIFIYSFFKFGWAFRLFNYCSILIGAVPHPEFADVETRRKKALQAAEMNIIAGRHFTAGLHGLFQALAYLGWFISPKVFFVTTLLVIFVIVRRQYFSKAHAILTE